MLRKALIQKIKTLNPRVYSPKVEGDKLPTRPFYVLDLELSNTDRTKVGIHAYVWKATVTVVADDDTTCDDAAQELVDLLVGVEETLDGTIIDEITYNDETGNEIDDQTEKTVNQVDFEILTANR